MKRWVRYAGCATLLTLVVLGVGGWALDEAGRRGVFLAAAVALPVQLGVFALLVSRRTGSPGFLAAWVGSSLLRLCLVGGVAWTVHVREDIDPLAALLTLAGLLFVLLLLELVELRPMGTGSQTGK